MNPPFVPKLSDSCDTRYVKIFPNSEEIQSQICERARNAVSNYRSQEETEDLFKYF